MEAPALNIQFKSEVYIHLGWSHYNSLFKHLTNFLLTNYSFGKSVRTSTLCTTQVFVLTIVNRQIISLIIHCITIPVGQKFTYTKLTVPLNSLEKVYLRCTCGCISRPTFKLSASLLDIMGKSKEISKNLRKKSVDLHKSGSSLGAITKRLKVPRTSVQTIVRKYRHHGTTQPSYRSGRRRVLSPRDERTMVRKVQINPRTAAKDLVKMLEEIGTKVKW